LDVLFEHNHYSELVQKEIQNDLLLTEPEYLTVSLPSANCMKQLGYYIPEQAEIKRQGKCRKDGEEGDG